jgi:RNA polymerase sigma factor (sigma-70 family)
MSAEQPTPPATQDMREEERRLVERLVSADNDAWEKLLRDYGKLIYSAIHCALQECNVRVSGHETDDIYYSVFESLVRNNYRKLTQFRGSCSLGRWLYVIGTRCAFDYARSLARRPQACADSEEVLEQMVAADASAASDSLIESEKSDLLDGCLKRLEAQERLLLALCADGASADQIAAMLDISKDNVYVSKHRILTRLRQCLKTSEGV